MPPVKTTVSCPQCRLPVQVTLEQLFDVTQDPDSKRRFINGRFNLIQCQNCRFQGQVPTILLYHDNEKEMLISYVPMEMGLPKAEQERVIGKLVNEVINKLPQEKRKAYLFNTSAALTLQGMIERVLQADGITKEMLDAQRQRSQLMQKILQTPEDKLADFVKENDALLDETFFQMMTASAQANAAQGNEQGAQLLMAMQAQLLQLASYGEPIRKRAQTMEAVAKELQELGEKLTKDKIMELVLAADSDDKLAAYVSLVRPAFDYAFFEALTRRADKSGDDEKARLHTLRDKMLELTKAADAAEEERMQEYAELLRELTETKDLDDALAQNASRIDDVFMEVLAQNLDAAQKSGRKDVFDKLNRVQEAIVALMQQSAPPEIKFINELLSIDDPTVAETVLKKRASEVTQQLADAMLYYAQNFRQRGQEPIAERLEELQGIAIGIVMENNWKN